MRNLFIFAVLNLVFVSSATIAGVKPVQTREVIGLDKEYKVDVVNTSDESFLVQAWLEDLEGNKKNLPVIVTPPLFEISSNKRVSFVGIDNVVYLSGLKSDEINRFTVGKDNQCLFDIDMSKYSDSLNDVISISCKG